MHFFLKRVISKSRKACFLHQTSKIIFSRFIITIYYMGKLGVTRGYKGLQWITRVYIGLQGVTRRYKGLQGVTRGYKGIQGVIKRLKSICFPTRTSADTFSWSILHQIKVEDISFF